MAYPNNCNARVSNALKLLTKSIFSSSKRIAKVIKKANIIEIEKVIYNIRNYCKIKITEDIIEQKQLVNGSIWKTEILLKTNVPTKYSHSQKIQLQNLRNSRYFMDILWISEWISSPAVSIIFPTSTSFLLRSSQSWPESTDIRGGQTQIRVRLTRFIHLKI